MTTPAERRSLNIRRSFNRFLEDRFAIPAGMSGRVNYGDAAFDASSLDSWVEVTFLNDGAGKKAEALVQLDVRVPYEGARVDGDRYGTACQTLADLLHEALHVDSIPLYDYSTPTSPALIDKKKLVLVNGQGIFREPDEVRALAFEEGVWRISFTYRLRTVGDFAGCPYYD